MDERRDEVAGAFVGDLHDSNGRAHGAPRGPRSRRPVPRPRHLARPDHAVDRLGREVGAVREQHDSRLSILRQRLEPAAQRRSHSALPLRAAHDRRVGAQLVGTFDDDDLVHGARPYGAQHVAEHEQLLRRPEAACLAGGEDTAPITARR